jgi:hypothetical protein
MLKNISSHRYIKIRLYSIILFLSISLTGKTQSIMPFLRSMFLNQNVYKTKEVISLTRVYDLNNEVSIEEPEIIYRIKLDNLDFMRYRIVKEGNSPFIRLLPTLKFIPISSSIVDIEMADRSEIKGKSNPSNFVFKVNDEVVPNRQYLATERITGLPITLPIKFRKLDGEVQLSGNFSIGYAFGWKVRVNNNPYNECFLNIIPYAISVGTDQYFARNADDSFTEKKEAFALNYATMGIAYQFNKVNAGIFTGWDRMFNEKKDWVYQKKSWLSLGLGYKIGE